ncbi:hypothetical protein LIER_17059 [Lithospermum erythrorhizon]|uniref:DUF4283 domain-containing protein n=1 Tax=Lithospermum erythrorhizon TaxID=34254 RepID=A0AAV3QD12_LITER
MGKVGAQISMAKGGGGVKTKAAKKGATGLGSKGADAVQEKLKFGAFVRGLEDPVEDDDSRTVLGGVNSAKAGVRTGSGLNTEVVEDFPPVEVNSGCKSSKKKKGRLVGPGGYLATAANGNLEVIGAELAVKRPKSADSGLIRPGSILRDSASIGISGALGASDGLCIGDDQSGLILGKDREIQSVGGTADLGVDVHATSQVLASLGLGMEGLFDYGEVGATLFKEVLDSTEARLDNKITSGVATERGEVGGVLKGVAGGSSRSIIARSSKVVASLCDTTSTIAAKAKAKTQQPQKTFKSLFPENRQPAKGMRLDHFSPKDGMIVIDEEDTAPIESTWGFYLIGCFTGRFPGGKAVQDVTKEWGVKVRIFPYSKGWTIFRFHYEEDRDKVFNGGPYMIYGKTLMLKHIPSNGKIASKLGRPLCIDQFTCERSRASYAWILVEVDMRYDPIHEFPVHLPRGIIHTQRVSYEDFPVFCYRCQSFGHHYERCPRLKVLEKERLPVQVPPQEGGGDNMGIRPSRVVPLVPVIHVVENQTILSEVERTMERIVCDIVGDPIPEAPSGCGGCEWRLGLGPCPPPPMFDSS